MREQGICKILTIDITISCQMDGEVLGSNPFRSKALVNASNQTSYLQNRIMAKATTSRLKRQLFKAVRQTGRQDWDQQGKLKRKKCKATKWETTKPLIDADKNRFRSPIREKFN